MLRFDTNSPLKRVIVLALGVTVLGWAILDVLALHPKTPTEFGVGVAPVLVGALAYAAMRSRKGA